MKTTHLTTTIVFAALGTIANSAEAAHENDPAFLAASLQRQSDHIFGQVRGDFRFVPQYRSLVQHAYEFHTLADQVALDLRRGRSARHIDGHLEELDDVLDCLEDIVEDLEDHDHFAGGDRHGFGLYRGVVLHRGGRRVHGEYLRHLCADLEQAEETLDDLEHAVRRHYDPHHHHDHNGHPPINRGPQLKPQLPVGPPPQQGMRIPLGFSNKQGGVAITLRLK